MTNQCTVSGCHKPHLAKGYCAKHYRRFKLYGDPEGGAEFRDGKAKDFFDMAAIYGGDDCLLWPYSRNSDGYPCGGWDGALYKIHRLMCETAHGPQPSPQHEAAHNCGVRHCVNPRHLRWATHAENMADTKRHGTSPSGERSGRAKLSWELVRTMRACFSNGSTKKEISEAFGIHYNTVDHVIENRRWKESEDAQ